MIAKLRLILIVFAVGAIFESCATLTDYRGSILSQTNVTLSQNNFRYVKLAVGYAEAEYKLRVAGKSDRIKGGPEFDGIVLAAKKDLLSKNPLRDGQALANITIDTKYHTKPGFFSNKHWVRVTMTADIIEFR